jgi:hypothetical protein
MTDKQVTPKDPCRVNFTHADIPSSPDHSSDNPGPAGGADRAGYTKAILGKRLSIEWDNGPARADGMIALFVKTVTVDFTLDPISVAVSSRYATGSCPYKATLKHEIQDHAISYSKIFLSYRDVMVQRLNTVTYPTQTTPTWIKPDDVDSFQDALAQRLREIIVDVSAKLKAAMDADRKAKDSPEAYKAIYRQCRADEW